MRRRVYQVASVVVFCSIIVSACLIVPRSRFLLLSYVRSEPFYEGRSISYWVYLMGDDQPEVRSRAAFALGQIDDSGGRGTAELAQALGDPVDDVRINAALALNKMGVHAGDSAPALANALHDAHPLVRMRAALALTSMPDRSPCAVPALMEAMTQPRNYSTVQPFDHSVRQQAIRALGAIGPRAREAEPVLTDALLDGDKRIRANAAAALGRIRADSALPQLRLCLFDADELVRNSARDAIALLEASAKGVHPAQPAQ